jgi:hypothetical protein
MPFQQNQPFVANGPHHYQAVFEKNGEVVETHEIGFNVEAETGECPFVPGKLHGGIMKINFEQQLAAAGSRSSQQDLSLWSHELRNLTVIAAKTLFESGLQNLRATVTEEDLSQVAGGRTIADNLYEVNQFGAVFCFDYRRVSADADMRHQAAENAVTIIESAHMRRLESIVSVDAETANEVETEFALIDGAPVIVIMDLVKGSFDYRSEKGRIHVTPLLQDVPAVA